MKFSKDYINELIEKAWCDKTTFDDIQSSDNLKEEEIKRRAAHHLNKFHKKNSELGLGHPVIERMVQKMAKRA